MGAGSLGADGCLGIGMCAEELLIQRSGECTSVVLRQVLDDLFVELRLEDAFGLATVKISHFALGFSEGFEHQPVKRAGIEFLKRLLGFRRVGCGGLDREPSVFSGHLQLVGCCGVED